MCVLVRLQHEVSGFTPTRNEVGFGRLALLSRGHCPIEDTAVERLLVEAQLGGTGAVREDELGFAGRETEFTARRLGRPTRAPAKQGDAQGQGASAVEDLVGVGIFFFHSVRFKITIRQMRLRASHTWAGHHMVSPAPAGAGAGAPDESTRTNTSRTSSSQSSVS